jgi:hypothetical protein
MGARVMKTICLKHLATMATLKVSPFPVLHGVRVWNRHRGVFVLVAGARA